MHLHPRLWISSMGSLRMRLWKIPILVVSLQFGFDKALADCAKDPNGLRTPSPLEPSPLSANHGSSSPSAFEGQTSISTPLRLPMFPPDPPSTRLSRKVFNPEKFERNIQQIREANPFWFTPFRSSTLPPSYESPSTGLSNKTLNPEQFEKHLKDTRRDTNTFGNFEAFDIQDRDFGGQDWDPMLEVGTAPSTPTFKTRRTNSLVFGTPAFDEFKDLRYSPITHENVDKTLRDTQETDQLSFQEIFQIHQETQLQSSRSPKRKRETLDNHKRSTHYKCSQKNLLCVPRNEKSAYTTQSLQPNRLGTTVLQQDISYDQECHHQESPSSCLSSPPPKRRKVDLEGKENITPFAVGENKTKCTVWSKGKTGATKRRFLREQKMQQQGSFSCPQNRKPCYPQKDAKCENFFMYEGAKIMFNSPWKSSLKTQNHEHNEFPLSEPANPFNAEALPYCPPSNSPANLAQMKVNNAWTCHSDSLLQPFCDNTSGPTDSPCAHFSPLSTAQLRALLPPIVIVNTAQTRMSARNQTADNVENANQGGGVPETQNQPRTFRQVNQSDPQPTESHEQAIVLDQTPDLLMDLDIDQNSVLQVANVLHHQGPAPTWTFDDTPNRPTAPTPHHGPATGPIPPYATLNSNFSHRQEPSTQHQNPQITAAAHAVAPARRLDGMTTGFPSEKLDDASRSSLPFELGERCNCEEIRNTPAAYRELGVRLKCRLCDRVIGAREGESVFADREANGGYYGEEEDADYVEWMNTWVLGRVQTPVVEKEEKVERALFDF